MELYNSTIRELMEKLGGYKTQSWAYEPARAWKDLGQNELVLTRDAAFELGGGSNPASNCTCVTTDAALVPEDRIILVGPDLGSIRADTPFARLVLLHVNDISGDDQEAFRTIRDMEFVKYHVYPEGYMMRVSPENQREQVRVSKQAVASPSMMWFRVSVILSTRFAISASSLHSSRSPVAKMTQT